MGALSERLVLLILAALLLTGAAAIRISQVPERILHSDEAVQAYQVWRLMDEGHYEYSPEDRHGPVLYMLSAFLLELAGITGPDLAGDQLRLISTGAGLLLLAAFLGEAVRGRDPALLIGGALVAVTPFIIIYQNFFIQESLFALLSFALLAAVAFPQERMRWPYALAVGVLAALSLATKETALIHFAAIACACLLVHGPVTSLRKWPPTALMTAAASGIVVWVACMSLGFQRWDFVWAGIEAFVNYFERAGGAGHEKPFGYYFSLLWPQQQAGVRWSQLALLLGALAGTLFSWTRRNTGPSHQLWAVVAVFSWSLWLIYSVIPYKTPWLMLTPMIGFCLLSGRAIHALAVVQPRAVGWVLASIALLLAMAEPFLLWRPALYRYADDERNPYLYTHTSPGFGKLVVRLDEILGAFPDANVAVAEKEHAWPLPWYLREHGTTGYYQVLPDDPAAFDILVVDSRLLPEELPDTLSGYAVEMHGLRTNVLLYLFVRTPIWNHYLAEVRR